MKTRVIVFSMVGIALAGGLLFKVARNTGSSRGDPAEATTHDFGRAASPNPRDEIARGSAESHHQDGDETTSGGANRPVSQHAIGGGGRVDLKSLPDGRLKTQLSSLDPAARARALAAIGELQIPANDIDSLHVDPSGALFYVCTLGHEHRDTPEEASAVKPHDAPAHATAAAETFDGVVSISAVPVRHSRPGSPNKLYLDFTGHTVSGTAWNTRQGGAAVYECRPFNRDFEESTLNWWEREEIVVIWERVAEAFIGFDVDVTTEEPAVFDNRTARAVITSYRDANGVLNPAADASSGVAYLNVFGQPDYAEKHSVFFVYHPGQGTGSIADTIIHEFGHNLGLSHDGDAQREYYSGHEYGTRLWMPFMGTGYGTVAQWSKGEYVGANNPQDDLAIIGGKLATLPDDNPDVPAAIPQAVQNGSELLVRGAIERTSDSDSFTFSAGPGLATFDVRPEHMPTAYDVASRQSEVAVELRDSGGILIAQVAPDGTDIIPFSTTLAAGSYTLVVRGVGFGNPHASPPTGFTAYGSIGRYSVTGTIVPPVAHQAPAIASHPESQVIFAGNGVTFEVVARGNPATSYQWQVSVDEGVSWIELADGDGISGSSTAQLSVGTVTIHMDGSNYRCVVTNVAGTANSAAATLRIRSAPVIVTQPSSQYLNTGDSATFTVGALGSPPLSFQWRRNAASIPGATSASLTIPSITSANAGNYDVVVTNPFGSVVSASATLGVDAPPQVVEGPQSKGVQVGQDLSLSVSVTGSPTLTYQWSKGGAPLPGATNPALVIPAAGEGDSGQYSVSVSNAFGSATSGQATVVVGNLPTIVTQPASKMVLSGNVFSLLVDVTGTSPFAYQWSKDGAEIPGATGSTLNIWTASIVDEGIYSVRISNPIGTVVSEPAHVTVNAVPKIVVQPTSQMGVVSGNVTLTAAASGKPAPTLQWFKDGVEIDGANSPTLHIPDLSLEDDGSYQVVATNSVGSAASSHVNVIVYPALVASGSKVAAGNGHSLFIKDDASLWAMGRNESGQLGDGTRETRINPVKIAEGVASVAVGPGHSFFIKEDGTLWAMGHNGFGQLGDGTNVHRDLPVRIAQHVVAAAGGGGHSLFIKTDGTLWAMGYGANGQLGDGGNANQWTPVQVATTVMSVAAGNLHSLFVKVDGTGWAVGYNNHGQSAGGSAFNVMAPVQVGADLVEVSAGLEHSLLLKESGVVIAFGRTFSGQVVIANGVAAIAAGGSSNTFIKEDGTLWSMGDNAYGQLGRSGSTGVPRLVAEGVIGASISATHMIFAGLDRTIWTTGGNEHGQLGDGLTISRSAPLRIHPPSPPRITFQPEDQYGRAGSPVTFEVEAIGPEASEFQWLKDGAEISGAVGASYAVSAVTPETTGDYSVVVKNSWGSTISKPATLHWIEPIPIRARSVAAGVRCLVFIRPDSTAWGTGVLGEPGSGLPRFLLSDAVAVAAGDAHALLLRADGRLFGIGANAAGQLGDGTFEDRSEPVELRTGVSDVAANGSRSAFVLSDGTLWKMGTASPTPVPSDAIPSRIATGATSIDSIGSSHLFHRPDGALWGLGYVWREFDLNSAVHTTRPVLVAPNVTEVASRSHTMFVTADGSLRGVGVNYSGQLGDGTSELRTTPVLIASNVKNVDVGEFTSVFLKENGSLWGMGRNQSGELGLSDLHGTFVPLLMATSVAEMAVGPVSTIYRATDGSVWATGHNAEGQLGDGRIRNRFAFLRIDPASAPVITSQPVKEYGRVGSAVTFRIAIDGRGPFIFQWRKDGAPIPDANSMSLTLTNVTATDFGTYSIDVSNEFGAVASNTFQFVATGLVAPRVNTIALGNSFSLFLKGSGSLWAMGSNLSGQFGNSTNTGSASPILVNEGVLSISAAAAHSLILKNDRTLWSAGYNPYGQLGDGTTLSRATPVKVAEHVALISAGGKHSLFVKEDGTLWGMGSNHLGQLGDGTAVGRYLPVQIATGVIAASAGEDSSYFVRIDGTLWRMGAQLPSPDHGERDLPKQIATGVVDVAAGNYFALFLKSDNSLWAYGYGARAMFGILPAVGSEVPVKVADGVTKIVVGPQHMLFIKTDGRLWATGTNTRGMLGNGTNESTTSPVQVASDVAHVAASNANSAFVKQDGTVWFTGDNYHGQLGNGTDIDSWIPVQSATINELRINAQPASRAVVEGQSTTFAVSVAAFPAPTYQWRKNGAPISGATSPTLALANVSSADAGRYSVVVSNSVGSLASSDATLFVTGAPGTTRLINVSARAFAGSGGNTLIVGFAISGEGTKRVAIRGVGPKLADYNVALVVEDPSIRLYKIDGTLLAENDDWESEVAANTGGFSLPPGSKDAALVADLPAGGYTVHLVNPGEVAEAMIEVYDISQDPGSRLVNLSCRMHLAPGQIVIFGTALTGSSRPIVVRNSGPALAPYMLEADRPLVASDPMLRSYNHAGVLTGEVDDWDEALAPYFTVIGAFPFADASKDAAQRLVIQPGLNTIHASTNGEGGIVLIELYESP